MENQTEGKTEEKMGGRDPGGFEEDGSAKYDSDGGVQKQVKRDSEKRVKCTKL